MKWILTLTLGLSAFSAQAENRCFDSRPLFFQNFQGVQAEPQQLGQMMRATCQELRRSPVMFTPQDPFEKLWVWVGTGPGRMFFGSAVSAFEGLNKTAAQRAFKAELQEIREIPSSMERIRRVYELVVRFQGHYDDRYRGFMSLAKGGGVGWLTPSNLINNFERRGTAGVCREFSSLLQWSLMQVYRHSQSQSWALGENDFSSELVGGMLADGGDQLNLAHAWVRVNLPVYNQEGRLVSFQHFDLDSTWYPQVFSPLWMRRQGFGEESRESLQAHCDEIRQCLERSSH